MATPLETDPERHGSLLDLELVQVPSRHLWRSDLYLQIVSSGSSLSIVLDAQVPLCHGVKKKSFCLSVRPGS